jgi:hypothetical protein
MSFFRLQSQTGSAASISSSPARGASPARRNAAMTRQPASALRAPSRSLDVDPSRPSPRGHRANATALEHGDIDETSFSAF